MPFSSVSNLPALPLLAGAMSGSSLAIAIAPFRTPTVAEPGSSAGDWTPVLRRSKPGGLRAPPSGQARPGKKDYSTVIRARHRIRMVVGCSVLFFFLVLYLRSCMFVSLEIPF